MPDFTKLTHHWRGDVLALVAGAIMPIAYAPLSQSWVAIVGLALLFFLWQGKTPARAFRSGYLFGVGMFLVGVSWVAISMYQFSGLGLLGSALLTLLFVAILSLYPAAAGWLTAKLSYPRSFPVTAAIIAAGFWVLLEWVRSWLFTGFPWLALGYSQLDWPLVYYAPYLGVYGVSLAVALTAATIPLLLTRQSWNPAFALLLVVWGGGWAAGQFSWTEASGKPLKVSLIQGNVSQNLKWEPGQERPTFELYARLTREHFGSDIVVWPETAMPMFFHQAEPLLRGLMSQTRRHNTDLIVGMPVYDPQDDRYYNSLVSFNGEVNFYHKQHLVPFGEYIPFKQSLGSVLDLLAVPMSDFSPGPADQHLLKAGGVDLGASICYEDAFGEELIHALPQAKLLVNVSNDAWFGDSLAPHQHLQMAQMRALETGRWMLRGTNNGISALIDDRGRLQAVSPQFKEYVLTGQVQPRSGLTPYARFGNGPVLLIVLACIAWVLRRPVGRRKK